MSLSNIKHFANRHGAFVAIAGMFCLVTGCSGKMREQPKYKPLEASRFFDDGRSSRQLVPNTVARGQLRTDEYLYTGRADGELVAGYPFSITPEVLLRGQERFNIFCAPCHSQTGDGNGMVVQRGFPRPPSYHIERLREVPTGHIYDVITNGLGRMPSYSGQIPPRDRWAIVAYVRSLQLSQHVEVSELPSEDREELQEAEE